jgi:hypothetical protein
MLAPAGALSGATVVVADAKCLHAQAGSKKQNSLPPVNWQWVEAGDGYAAALLAGNKREGLDMYADTSRICSRTWLLSPTRVSGNSNTLQL